MQTQFPLYLRSEELNDFLKSKIDDQCFEIIDRRQAGAIDHFLWDGKKIVWVDHDAGNLSIDFLAPQRQWRFQNISRANEPLLRALDWHGERVQSVFDLTAGLGSDSTLLLFAGFDVTMFERDPILQLLLTHALALFQEHSPLLSQHIRLFKEDSIHYLSALNGKDIPDLIYLDPMYPTREKSALVKKELRIIRNLVGSDHDSAQLLANARALKPKRVVVKRPMGAEYIANEKPNHSIESPNTRFDVYLTL